MERNKMMLVVGKEEARILKKALQPLAEQENKNIVFKRLQANIDNIHAMWENKDRAIAIQKQLKEKTR